MSEYVAVAAGEKRLREILTDGAGFSLTEVQVDLVVEILTGAGVTADYKPRLKAVLLTVPMPDKRTEQPEAGGVPPELVPDHLADAKRAGEPVTEAVDGVEIGPDGVLPVASPAPIVPRFGGDFRPRVYRDEDDLRDIGIYSDDRMDDDYRPPVYPVG